ncbi:MAG: BatD family protein [Parvicellaceae bacterium]
MLIKRFTYLAVGLFIIFTFNSRFSAQNFSIKAFVNDNQIKSNEYIKYTVETNKKVNVIPPNFSDFSIVQGPYSSSSSSVSIINGKMDRTQTYTLTYLLSPNKTGQLEILPASADYNGQLSKSKSIKITVGANQKNNSSTNVTVQTKDKNLFAKISLSKTTAYMGENILASYKIYTRYNRMQIIDYEFPMTNGFWTEEVTANKNGWPQKQEVINGLPYNVITLKKEIISPQKTGELIIPPIEIKALLNQDFFNRGFEKTFSSNKVKINVKNFPKGAPKTFNEQVGKNYQLNVKYSTKELHVDEPLDLTIEVSGKGNLKQLQLPEIKYPSDFEIFPAENKEKIKIAVNGISGKKIQQQLLIPRHHGDFEIPEIIFTYFDISTKKYKTLAHPAQKVTVLKATGKNNTGSSVRINNQEDVVMVNDNIRHIQGNTALNQLVSPLFGTFKYWILLTAPGLLFFFLFLFKKFSNKNKNSFDLVRKKAGKAIEKRFSKASTLINENKIELFYEELYRAWLEYISIKFKLPISNLNKETILLAFEKHKIPAEINMELTEILEQCELARYAPISNKDSEKTLNKSKSIISKIENHAKI